MKHIINLLWPDVVNICDILMYLWYMGNNNIWCPKNCNLQELYIKSDQLVPPVV